jgi:putative phosphoesterase
VGEAALRVGLVSDTHGLFEPRLADLFRGCDLILHAGDIVTPGTLDELGRLAPVTAVRGNNDHAAAFDALPELTHVALGELTAVLVHQIGGRGRLLPEVQRAVSRHHAQLLVHGHSHRPGAALDGALLVVNPGSAGPRRFSLPRAAGMLHVVGRQAEIRLHDLTRPRLPLLARPLVARFEAEASPGR